MRRKLVALSSLFAWLCERNAVAHNPVDGVTRPPANGKDGTAPTLGDAQARRLLNASDPATLKSQCDRAVLAMLGHADIAATAIYTTAVGIEARTFLARMWERPTA